MSRSRWLTDVAGGDDGHHPDPKFTDCLADFSDKQSGHIELSRPSAEFGRCVHRAWLYYGGLAAHDSSGSNGTLLRAGSVKAGRDSRATRGDSGRISSV